MSMSQRVSVSRGAGRAPACTPRQGRAFASVAARPLPRQQRQRLSVAAAAAPPAAQAASPFSQVQTEEQLFGILKAGASSGQVREAVVWQQQREALPPVGLSTTPTRHTRAGGRPGSVPHPVPKLQQPSSGSWFSGSSSSTGPAPCPLPPVPHPSPATHRTPPHPPRLTRPRLRSL